MNRSTFANDVLNSEVKPQ